MGTEASASTSRRGLRGSPGDRYSIHCRLRIVGNRGRTISGRGPTVSARDPTINARDRTVSRHATSVGCLRFRDCFRFGKSGGDRLGGAVCRGRTLFFDPSSFPTDPDAQPYCDAKRPDCNRVSLLGRLA